MPIGEVDPSFLQEVWALYVVGLCVLGSRFAIRLRSVGIRGMVGDDFFALLVLILYTVDAFTVHIVYYAGTNVEASVVQVTRTLTDEEIAEYTFGSKVELVAWYSYTALIWALKGTMLCFFHRMTIGLWQHRLVKWISLGCVASYTAVFLTITFGCFPVQDNWQVTPDPGLRCTFKKQNFLVAVVFNVITDASILLIPVPLLWTLQVPWKKKIVISLLLCSGLFVISAAIIRVVLTLGSHPSALNVNRWGVRETIVGIITVNIPILRPLFNRNFWKTGQFTYETGNDNKTGGRSTTQGSRHGPYEMNSSVSGRSRRQPSFGAGSEEFIIHNKDGEPVRPGGHDVFVQTMYRVTSEDIDLEHGTNEWGTNGGSSKAVVYTGN